MTVSMTEPITPLWHRTPLIFSDILSSRLGYDIYLKLEILQPPQSFKFRGLSLLAQELLQTHGPSVCLVIASGGNAALALSHAAHACGIASTVFVTLEAAKSRVMIETMQRLGSDVQIGGIDYADALKNAQAFVEGNNNAVMVPAYDHPTLWRGISSMIEEIKEQLPEHHVKPEAILCSVGGGSLIGGTIVGCKSVGWDDVRLIALETQGSDCFYQTLRSNPIRRYAPPTDSTPYRQTTMASNIAIHVDPIHGVTIATLPAITSLAASLGAARPSAGVVKSALDRAGFVTNVSAPDELAMKAALEFADDHKMIVELACSVTMTPAYCPPLFKRLFGEPEVTPLATTSTNGDDREVQEPLPRKALVFIVCGGFKTSLAQLSEFDAILKKDAEESVQREVEVDESAIPL